MQCFLYFLITVFKSDMLISKGKNQCFGKKIIQNQNFHNIIAQLCVIAFSVQCLEHTSIQELFV